MEAPPLFTFSRNERLRQRKAFKYLFSSGKHLTVGCIRLVYTSSMPAPLQSSPLMAGVSVPKKKFKKATDRNLLKRRLREAHRQHKYLLLTDLKRKEQNLVILYIYQGKHIASYQEIENLIVHGMNLLHKKTGLSKG